MLAAAGLLGALLVPHAPLLLGRVSPTWDGIDFFAPYYMLVGDFARNGEFLLWNPFTFGGLPDYLEPVLGSFSPLVVLFGFVFGGTPLSFELYWLAIWLLGGLGLLALARHLGAPAWGGFVAAIAFMFSGFYTGNAEHSSKLYALSLLPWLVWRVDVALATGRLRPAVETGALYGLSGLGGYPPLVLLNGGFVLLWSVGRLLWPDGIRSGTWSDRSKRLIGIHAIAGLLAAAIWSPTYIPFFIEGPDVSDRAGPLPWDDAVENDALHPAALVTFSSPALALADIFGYTDISMRSVYVGCLVLSLAAFALVNRGGTAFRWWLLLVGVLFLASAMGRTLPLRGWLYEWLPPTRYFRHAALFRGYAIFALAVLGLLGASDLAAAVRARDWQRWRRFAVVAFCLGAAALLVYTGAIAFIRRTTPPPHVASHWHTWGTWLALCAVASFAAAATGHRWRERAAAALVVLAVADALSTARLVRSTMYQSDVARWHAVDVHHRAELDLTRGGLMRRVDNDVNHTFVSKTPAIQGFSGLASRLVRRYATDDALVQGVTGANRLWFSRSVAMVDRSEDCFDVFRARAASLGAAPLVVHPRPDRAARAPAHPPTGTNCEAELSSLPAATLVKAFEVAAYHPTRLVLRVDVPEAGWLLVTDTWSRRWRVTVDGGEGEILPGNFVFRAVNLAAGTHTLDFRYDPIGFPWLLMLSWGTLLLVATWSIGGGLSQMRAIQRSGVT
jgi:multisubunit Na+/H+ antiporter MnhG subunit